LRFTVIKKGVLAPKTETNHAFLYADLWNDYSYITQFYVLLFDENGEKHDLGNVKIGFVGQTTSVNTYDTLNASFRSLPKRYFSLGQDVDYYVSLSKVSDATRNSFLTALQDIVIAENRLDSIKQEDVFQTSLLRTVSLSALSEQYRRVLDGGAPLSDFDFNFVRTQTKTVAGIDLKFVVKAGSLPSTNIHALIGRNGVGKTTLLNDMISAVMGQGVLQADFLAKDRFSKELEPIPEGYFSSLVSVAFSAFDSFTPPQERSDPKLGTRYSYIGLKDIADDSGTLLKSLETLREECVASLGECFSDRPRRQRWLEAIRTLESDENFAQMDLPHLLDLLGAKLKDQATNLVERMSSGHAVVLLTISRLVARVEEKTLILIDEPESHLHPPLLSAFTRALSELLHNRNGVAIIATHSPVVLQEVPRSCVYVITRSGLSIQTERPRIETFGENVGSLTREVFGLEVSQSGFHALLQDAVSRGESYEEIVASYNDQLGLEARGILRAMVADRDSAATIV
jgi:ABC-type branched-subunit amino acid transport system ATPase component